LHERMATEKAKFEALQKLAELKKQWGKA